MVSPNQRLSRSLVVLFLLILFVTALAGMGPLAAAASAPQPVKIHVWPAQSMAPANLLVQIILERNPENRLIRIIAESPAYFSSSDLPLEGDRTARVRSLVLRSLPAGDYEVRGEVIGFDGRVRARARATAFVAGLGAGPALLSGIDGRSRAAVGLHAPDGGVHVADLPASRRQRRGGRTIVVR
jgi:hypothetical protein